MNETSKQFSTTNQCIVLYKYSHYSRKGVNNEFNVDFLDERQICGKQAEQAECGEPVLFLFLKLGTPSPPSCSFLVFFSCVYVFGNPPFDRKRRGRTGIFIMRPDAIGNIGCCCSIEPHFLLINCNQTTHTHKPGHRVPSLGCPIQSCRIMVNIKNTKDI